MESKKRRQHNFFKNLPIMSIMGPPRLTCALHSAIAIYDYLTTDGGLLPESLDAGYPVINWHNSTVHEGEIQNAGDSQIQCEEIWETALSTLDQLGEAAQWKEDPDLEGSTSLEKELIEKYQRFRRLIEHEISRPISWILNAPPTSPVNSVERKDALKFRRKVRDAILYLKQKIPEKLDPALQMIEPDYTSPASKPLSYWIVSLRHFLMTDLAQLGLDQLRQHDWHAARMSLEQVFNLGQDSTAYSAMIGYTHLLGERHGIHPPVFACSSQKTCAKTAVELYPHEPIAHHNQGMELLKSNDFKGAFDSFFNALDLDPRYPKPADRIISILKRIRSHSGIKNNFREFLEKAMARTDIIIENHPAVPKSNLHRTQYRLQKLKK